MLLDGGRKVNCFVLVGLLLAGIVVVAFFGLRESPDNLATVLLAIIAILGTSYASLAAANAAEHKHKGGGST